MPTLGDMKTSVQKEVAKGTSLDGEIPDYIRRAALWLEQNYTVKAMERFVSFTLPETKRAWILPSLVKRIDFIRFQRTGEDYKYPPLVNPRDVLKNDAADPTGYWIDGRENVFFDNAPTTALPLEMSYVGLTNWPTSDSATNFWLLEGESALLYQTLYMIAARSREPEQMRLWRALRDEQLASLMVFDSEMRDSNRNEVMNYNG